MESTSGYSIGFKCRCSRKLYVRVTTEPFSETALETSPHVVEPILHSLTFEDVGRLLQLEGHSAKRVEQAVTGGPGWRTTGDPRFDAVPYFESEPGSPQYRALWPPPTRRRCSMPSRRCTPRATLPARRTGRSPSCRRSSSPVA